MKNEPIKISVECDLDENARKMLADRAGERRVKYVAMALAAWLGGVAGWVVWWWPR